MVRKIDARVLIGALVGIIILLSFYIAWDKYIEYQTSVQKQAYILGYNQGMKDAVTQLIDGSKNCQPVPVFYHNVTRWFIDMNCTHPE